MMGKVWRLLMSCIVFLSVGLASVSCSKDEYLDYEEMDSYSGKYNAVVTVKSDESGKVFFQLDDETTLEPVGWKNPYGGEVRALLNYTELPDDSDSTSRKIRVNESEPILTLDPTESKSPSRKFKKDNSPVIVYADWLTSCEDGYLTIHIAALSSKESSEERFILDVDPSVPSDFYLRHNREDDDGELAWKEYMIAFRIYDFLKPGADGFCQVRLHNYSYEGLLTFSFECKSK